MSENPIIKLVPNFVDNALEEPAREIGDFLGNIFFSVFSPINFPMKKYRIKKEIELRQYEEDIKTELSRVEKQNLIEPKLNIVGPALEASKYYISSTEHRKMFAKLIASSMDKEKTNLVHPAFTEIIKQMSPLDAKLFQTLFKDSKIQIPKIKLRVEVSPANSTGTTLLSSVLPSTFYDDNFNYAGAIRCLDNLERHKLVTISDGEIKFDDLTRLLGRTETYEDITIPFNAVPFGPSPELKYQNHIKGSVAITSFGDMFYTSVL